MTTVTQEIDARTEEIRWLRLLRSWLSDPVYVSTALLVLIAILAPLLAPYDPVEVDREARVQPPSLQHWFGTDQNGMDIFSRVLYGARVDLSVAISAAAIAVVIGVPLGALAGYWGNLFDDILLRGVESIQSFPTLLLGLAVLAALGSDLLNLVFVIAFVNIPVYIKLTRSAVLPLRNNDYVHAARCAGSSTFAIIQHHILPNISGVIFAQFPVNCAWAIQILAALSFIGLGVRVPEPEWGAMIKVGADYIVFGDWWVSVFPGLTIFGAVLMLNRLGEKIRISWQGNLG
jgi:peptide/nickel transport system permease protein